MSLILILREELVCLIVLAFLACNAGFFKMGKDTGCFIRMTALSFLHVVFDIITVWTVNNVDTLPMWLFRGTHAIFYLTAILFSCEFFCYVCGVVYPKADLTKVRRLALIPVALYIPVMPLLKITYTVGSAGTNYSSGPVAVIGYSITFVYFLISAFLLIKKRASISKHTKVALFPMLSVLILCELAQVIVPEMLFTGAAVSIVTIGFFFSLENPADVFRQKMQIDALTGVKSRHSYEMDVAEIDQEYASFKNSYIVVFSDINNLKAVNTLYGHLEGDAYISSVAQILLTKMKNARSVYRMGGDEFLTLYVNKPVELVREEIQAVQTACAQQKTDKDYAHNIAMGYAVSGREYKNIREVLKVADYLMYKNKAEMKKETAYMPGIGEKINISGLTDRTFDAFANSSERSYPFITNMETNVTRVAPGWVEEFELPGEFIFNFNPVWLQYIHPNDRKAFLQSMSGVLTGRETRHTLEYRALNKRGEYVVCSCHGYLLPGKKGEPDMFAGTLVNHGIAEIIDPVTGLHNNIALAADTKKINEQRVASGFMQISVLSFSRVNMLYGYASGNDVLRQFADAIVRILDGQGEIFRLDGTNFIIRMPNASRETLEKIYARIAVVAENDIRIAGSAIPLQLAAGAFLMPADYTGDLDTVRSSLIYVHDKSKEEKQGRLVFGETGMVNGLADYKLLSMIHQDALTERRGFYLRYQPIVDLESDRIIGTEALLRWHGENGEEIAPGRFIPWMEDDPCFFELGSWILNQAMKDTANLSGSDTPLSLNVNITARQLQNPEFRQVVQEALRMNRFPANRLCLELTERCRDLDVEFLSQELDFFHSIGVKMALDDIGTGASAFSLLLKLPFDEVKLDHQFVRELPVNNTNRIFAESIMSASAALGFKICFEGIENEETYNYMKQMGSNFYQGYFFAKPLLLEDFRTRLSEKK